MTDLDTLIRNLAAARRDEAAAKEGLTALQKALYATPEYMELKKKSDAASEQQAEATTAINELARAAYEGTGEKHPHVAAEIKVFPHVNVVSQEAAKAWCITNLTGALYVDMRALASAAKIGVVPAEIATITEETRVYIKGDLSEYLPKDEA